MVHGGQIPGVARGRHHGRGGGLAAAIGNPVLVVVVRAVGRLLLQVCELTGSELGLRLLVGHSLEGLRGGLWGQPVCETRHAMLRLVLVHAASLVELEAFVCAAFRGDERSLRVLRS